MYEATNESPNAIMDAMKNGKPITGLKGLYPATVTEERYSYSDSSNTIYLKCEVLGYQHKNGRPRVIAQIQGDILKKIVQIHVPYFANNIAVLRDYSRSKQILKLRSDNGSSVHDTASQRREHLARELRKLTTKQLAMLDDQMEAEGRRINQTKTFKPTMSDCHHAIEWIVLHVTYPDSMIKKLPFDPSFL